MKKNVVKSIIKLIIVITISYLIGFIYNNYNIIINHNTGINRISNKNISYNGFKVENNQLVSTSANPKINIEFDNITYINKLKFDYELENYSSWVINATVLNKNEKEENIQITRKLNKNINIFSQLIDRKVKRLSITFEKNNIKISNIKIANQITPIALNYSYFILIGICIFILINFRKYFKNHIEFLFATLALTSGLIILFNNPIAINKSWDDEIHITNAYSVFHNNYSGSIYILSGENNNFMNNSYDSYDTDEEKLAFAQFLNTINNDSHVKIKNTVNYNKVSYLPQSIIFLLSEKIGISFSTTQFLCIMVSLLSYVIVVFFAIRKTPIAKYLMLVIGLIPTTIFMSASFSYDPPVTSLILLGLSYFLYEKSNTNEKLSTKNALIIILSFIIATCTKAIYIPLLLILLLLPKEKFYNSKCMTIFKTMIIIITILMMSTFVLPVLSNSMEPDYRGGDTNVSQQLKIATSSPVSTTKVFYENSFKQFFTKLFSKSAILNFAYMKSDEAYNSYYLLLILLFLSVVLINYEKKEILAKKEKIFILLLVLFIIFEIWISLYLTFTPVGNDIIKGVQDRYFIPLLFPLLVLFSNDSIKIDMESRKIYNIYSICLTTISILYLLVFI